MTVTQQRLQEAYLNDKSCIKIPNPFTGEGFIRFDNPTMPQRQFLEYSVDLITYLDEISALLKEYPNDFSLGENVRKLTRNVRSESKA